PPAAVTVPQLAPIPVAQRWVARPHGCRQYSATPAGAADGWSASWGLAAVAFHPVGSQAVPVAGFQPAVATSTGVVPDFPPARFAWGSAAARKALLERAAVWSRLPVDS